MATVQLKKYPVDTTGKSPDNLVANERHEVDPLNRAIVPREGFFYGESMVVRNNDTQLILGTDYRLDDINDQLTKETGKAIFSAIILLKESIMGYVTLTYQCYGRGDEYTPDYLAQLVKEATVDKVVKFNDIINRPSAYNPAPHRHPIGQVIYWNSAVNELRNLTQVIENLRIAHDRGMYAFVGDFQTKLLARLEAMENLVREARDVIGTVDKFKQSTADSLAGIEAKVRALSNLNELQAYMDNMKRELDAELKRVKAETAKVNQADIVKLQKELSDLKITVGTKTAQQEVANQIAQAIANLPTNEGISHLLAQYAKKTEIVNYRPLIDEKISRTDAETKIAEAAKKAEWAKLTGKPKVLTHDELDRYTDKTNDVNKFIMPGTYSITAGYGNMPSLRHYGTNLEGNTNLKGVLEVIGDKSSGVIYQRLNIGGLTFTRNGTVNGEFVTYPNRWDVNVVSQPAWNENISLSDRSVSSVFAFTNTMPNLPTMPGFSRGQLDESMWTSAQNYDGVGFMMHTPHQRTAFMSLGGNNHYIMSNDGSVGSSDYTSASAWTVDRLITHRDLKDNFPDLFGLGDKLADLQRKVVAAASSQVNINTQNNLDDIASDKVVKLFDGGCVGVGSLRLKNGGGNALLTVTTGGVLDLGNQATVTSLVMRSDKRLKTSIKRIEKPVEKLSQLNGYTYQFKDKNVSTAGLLAQEVKEVLPTAVVEQDDGMLSLDYNAVIALLVETVNEQSKRIEKLEEQVSELTKSKEQALWPIQ
jgi:phage related tail fiber protein|nr:MAG TPA: structural protein [Caudoviricetes sp.]